MNVTCKPIKEVFKSPTSDYRVLSCIATGELPNELALNKWGNFTLSGSNLTTFNLREEYPISIRLDNRSKYEASYIVTGFQGIEVGEAITVDPNVELKFLKSIMTSGQAENVHAAYPNFIELVLNNRETEISYDKIANVGPVYLEKYIDKIKASYKSILFMGIASDWEIEGDKKIEKMTQEFATPDEAYQALQTNPYRVLVDVVEYSFGTADAKVLQKMPDMIDSKERCEYGCLKILRDNEEEGDTRINVHTLSRLVKDIVPEAYQHIFESVTDNDLIYYDTESKNVSIKNTYNNEYFIAQEILRRVKKKENFGMEWEKFREVDGFKCTDEQAEILKLANENNIMLLTGSAGSGKSTAMVCLIRMLEHYMKSYTILAPTGVASKRIASTTGRTASTIHMFLARLGDSYCQSEYIIIDEFSMVGVELFANLLSTIPNSKIILIGDEAQLASISCGNILYDIICSNIVPRANLTKVFRYGIGGISTVATDIREGRPYLDETGNPTFHVQVDDYNFINITNKMENVIPQILETYEELLNKGYDKTDIMVLSPQNIGLVGTYKINEAIQTRFNNHVYTDVSYERQTKEGKVKICFKVGDRVVNTHNNYKSPIMEQDENGLTFTGAETLIANGDIGYIRDCVSDNELGNYLVVQYDEHLIGVVGNAIEDLLLGYAITIHKCVSGETLVYTNKGIKSIASLEDNWEEHQIFNGQYFETPSNFFANPKADCIKLRTTRGVELTGLPGHGVDVISEDGFIERRNLADLKIGENIIVCKNSEIYGNTPALHSEQQKDVREKIYQTPTEMSPEFAEFLGIVCADGTVYNSGFRMCKRHKEVADRFEVLCKELFGADCKRFHKILKKNGAKGAYYCEVNSTFLARWLVKIEGVSPNNKFIPQIILGSNKSCQCAFLRGLFEDGTVNLKRGKFDHVEFVAKQEKMSIQVQTMLLNMGIVSTRKKNEKLDYYCIYIYKGDIGNFASDIGFISETKQQALETAVVEVSHKAPRHKIPNIGKVCREVCGEHPDIVLEESVNYSIKKDNDLTYLCLGRFIDSCINSGVISEKLDYLKFIYNRTDVQKIESIEPTLEKTYCLEMPETHKFVQNGIYGWNCQGSQSKAVLLVTHKSQKKMLKRNILYVGTSRAQEYLVQIGDVNSISCGLEDEEQKNRDTWLQDLLKEEN